MTKPVFRGYPAGVGSSILEGSILREEIYFPPVVEALGRLEEGGKQIRKLQTERGLDI